MRLGLAWGCLLAVTLSVGCGTTLAANERFTLSWRDTNQDVHTRFSSDGTTWTTAGFPSVATNLGPGAAADRTGVSYLVAMPNPGGARATLVWGIGTNNYSQFPDNLGPLPGGAMNSAPAIAHAGSTKWLFAFRAQQSARVLSFDSGPKTFTNVTPTAGVANTLVEGRPSIAVMGTRVVATWFRNANGGEIHVVVGDADAQGNVTWQPGFALPNTETGFGAVRAQHDLTHDHTNFVLGVLRPDDNPPGPLQTFTMFFYDSPDGLIWTRRTQVGVAVAPFLSLRTVPTSIAAHSNGTIVMAQNPPGGPQVFRFNGSFWAFTNTQVFTGTPEPNTDFALISSGRP